VLSTDNADGDLVFIDVGSTGTATTAIELGVNVRSGDAGLDFKGVFSEYIVKGQRAGNDSAYAGDVSEEEGYSQVGDNEQLTGDTASTRDSRAKRRRVLVIKQSGQADEGTCQDRAEYERANRAAKALQTTYVVSGWRQDSGDLWQSNQMVTVRDPLIGFNGVMVIAGIAWVLDDTGQRVELRVGPPDGYRSKAGKLKASASQKGGGKDWSDVK
jgi:prophage tail gpP-like protein